MNYWNWIFPFLILILLIGFYLAKKLQKINPNFSFKISWFVISIIFGISILMRNILAIFFFYTLLFHILYDILKWIISFLPSKTLKMWIQKIYFHGIPILCISLTFILYGTVHLSHPVLKEYDIKIKTEEKINFNIGMVSDVHLGITPAKKTLQQLVEHANELNADIFLLVGDIFDEFTSEEEKEMAYESISQIKTKYGIYFVEGNHDLLNEKTKNAYEQHKIQVLDDKVITINNQLNLIGRKDARNNREGNPRKKLEDLITLADPKFPIILIDHQPKEEKLAEKLGIDLQLSGHTHNGQFFPLNFFLKYGYQKKNNYQRIVSSGYGGWGIKARTAGKSEMLKIKVTSE